MPSATSARYEYWRECSACGTRTLALTAVAELRHGAHWWPEARLSFPCARCGQPTVCTADMYYLDDSGAAVGPRQSARAAE